MAILPSADSATEAPCPAPPAPRITPVPTSLLPCLVHTPPTRVYTHAAPSKSIPPRSTPPPTMVVFPSADSATQRTPIGLPLSTRLMTCWLHAPPERVYTHSAPCPTTAAVFPSLDSATESPCAFPTAPASLLPCWLHTPPERVYTPVAPAEPLFIGRPLTVASVGPVTAAVFPSPDSAAE